MAIEDNEFQRTVYMDLVSHDPDVRRLAKQRLYVLMTGHPATNEAMATETIKAMAAAITEALEEA